MDKTEQPQDHIQRLLRDIQTLELNLELGKELIGEATDPQLKEALKRQQQTRLIALDQCQYELERSLFSLPKK